VSKLTPSNVYCDLIAKCYVLLNYKFNLFRNIYYQ